MGKLIAKIRKLLKKDRIKRSKKTVADVLPKRDNSTTLRNRMDALKVQIDRMLAYQNQLLEQLQPLTDEQLQKVVAEAKVHLLSISKNAANAKEVADEVLGVIYDGENFTEPENSFVNLDCPSLSASDSGELSPGEINHHFSISESGSDYSGSTCSMDDSSFDDSGSYHSSSNESESGESISDGSSYDDSESDDGSSSYDSDSLSDTSDTISSISASSSSMEESESTGELESMDSIHQSSDVEVESTTSVHHVQSSADVSESKHSDEQPLADESEDKLSNDPSPSEQHEYKLFSGASMFGESLPSFQDQRNEEPCSDLLKKSEAVSTDQWMKDNFDVRMDPTGIEPHHYYVHSLGIHIVHHSSHGASSASNNFAYQGMTQVYSDASRSTGMSFYQGCGQIAGQLSSAGASGSLYYSEKQLYAHLPPNMPYN